MARNKYPQETIDKIIAVSMQLFIEQGYEQTSIQDIIDHLGGLTKGAIYHHFKSKEDILLALADQLGTQTANIMGSVRDDPTLTGREKIQKMFHLSLQDSRQRDVFVAAPRFLENPRFLAILFKSIVSEVAPDYIAPIVRQGVADGSIQTDHPDELGELIILLSDFWLNPLVWPATQEQTARRLALYNQLFRPYGLHLLDDEAQQALLDFQSLSDQKAP